MYKLLSAAALLWLLASPVQAEEPRDPETLFNQYCFSCHGTGWDNAPVIGDSYAWDERREKGMDVLLKHTLEGFNSMPPKGNCGDCSQEELKAVITWMLQ